MSLTRLSLHRLIQLFLLVSLVTMKGQASNEKDTSTIITSEPNFLTTNFSTTPIKDVVAISMSTRSENQTTTNDNSSDRTATSSNSTSSWATNLNILASISRIKTHIAVKTFNDISTSNSLAREEISTAGVYNIATTTSLISTTTITTTTTTLPCTNPNTSFDVTYRQHDGFIAVIYYNCLFTDWNNFTLENVTAPATCNVSDYNSTNTSTIVNVTCNNISMNAGRNWEFRLLRDSSSSNYSVNNTFIVTLLPLNLTSTNITIKVHENDTASIFIPNCTDIADTKNLIIECGSPNGSNKNLTTNCTQMCEGLIPGSIFNVTLIRLPILLVDTQNTSNISAPEDTLVQSYSIDLDKVKNLISNTSFSANKSAIIYFNAPRGLYDKIYFECTLQNRTCINIVSNVTNATTNCSGCNSISISEIYPGMNYTCQATTIKEKFRNMSSDKFFIETKLESSIYNGMETFNTSNFSLIITQTGDFDRILSRCTTYTNQPFPCQDFELNHERCETNLKFHGTLGCNYSCLLTTTKPNYSNITSNQINISLNPPIPNITDIQFGSRWIYITWKIKEISYIKSFDIMKNNAIVESLNTSLNTTTYSYNYSTNINPFQSYTLQVTLNSNINVQSETESIRTLEEAPKAPSDNDTKAKIIPQENNNASTTTQYVIDIDTSLFSETYGRIIKYLIYVRQNQTNDKPEIELNGTYIDALRNISFDYLALEIPIDRSKPKGVNYGNNTSILIGNETKCANESIAYTPCNGPLKESTVYKLLVGGCTAGGCTYVLSNQFETKKGPDVTPAPKSSSIAWVVIFPLLALVIVVAILAKWKQRPLKRFINTKFRNFKRPSKDTRQSTPLSTMSNSFPRKKPKRLIEYLNINAEEEKAINEEYRILDTEAPNYRSSGNFSEYSSYNRYANIPARGPWEDTAVRLTGTHRIHDYINANEIKGLRSSTDYIACQGPLEGTCEDFWDMIIQYRSKKIVMLTKIEERNPHKPTQVIAKCHQYFPKNKGESKQFGDINVTVRELDDRSDIDLQIRSLDVTNGTTHLLVYHYYYTGWPDFSVVDAQKLLNLIETVNNHETRSLEKIKEFQSVPLVVHCSAGVGRTGTFIAVDIIIKLINRSISKLSTVEIDVMGIVTQLRQSRAKMVQTKDQYTLVNRCVQEYLKKINKYNEVLQNASDNEYAYASPASTYENATPNQKGTENYETIPDRPSYVNSRKK